MAELVKQSLAHVQKVETRAAVKHIATFTIVAATAILVIFYDAATEKFTPDPKSLSDCGYACHTPVRATDYIFHAYQKR